MQLTDDRTVDATGTVGNRQVFHFADGQALAKATLVPEDGGKPVPVVWWEPGRAPPDGARVRVKGRIREFGGETELHADETTVERAGTANGPLAAIAAFYLACVEAEAASSLRLRLGGKGHIVLREGANPLHETLHFAETSPHYGWFQARQAAVGETLLSGWPLVVGIDPDTGKGGPVASPLLIAEAELSSSEGAWQLRTLSSGVDLNPFALDLLELDREARDELVAAVEASVEVEESATPAARSHAILRALREEGIDGLEGLDPATLSSASDARGIHNAGVVVRAGNAGQRNEVADYIASALSSNPRHADSAGARRAWAGVEEALRQIYEFLHERSRLDAELNDREARLKATLDGLPADTRTDADIAELGAALADACRALDAFGERLWWFGRWRRHRRRLDDARHALGRLGGILGSRRSELEQCLSSVADRPKRTLAPRNAFRPVERIAADLRNIAEYRRQIHGFRTQLAALPREHELDDHLDQLRKERLDAGTALLDARWAELRHENPGARTAALELADFIERMASRTRGARKQAFRAVPVALPALPVWAVTNLSARTNLPLTPDLFDLVVIDEASQCDIASALPLLVRGKRALIVGDQKQLIHITSLSRGREHLIARKLGLTDARIGEFSYRDRSCFTLASSRVSAAPIFLDLHFRSHPAIVGFSNERFYGGRLELCSAAAPPKGLRAVQWIRVAGKSEKGPGGRSRVNAAEAQRIVQAIVRGLPTYKGLECSIGIVTPYGAQARRIETLLSDALDPDDLASLKIATAHRFQGDERDIMYFSPVIDRSMTAREVHFAANPNLVNVALTRARRRLIIVGDPDACLAHDNALRGLANYALRLDASGFDSPLELALCEALLKRGVAARTGVVVGKHRLDLAVERDGVRLDIECDGAAFHTDHERDSARDHAVEAQGWTVMRLSGRALSRDLDACVDAIVDRLSAD